MTKQTSRDYLSLLLMLTMLVLAIGCDSGGNTVVQPDSQEPTAEETAAYEKEIEEMSRERD